jgi:hypothetical protein
VISDLQERPIGKPGGKRNRALAVEMHIVTNHDVPVALNPMQMNVRSQSSAILLAISLKQGFDNRDRPFLLYIVPNGVTFATESRKELSDELDPDTASLVDRKLNGPMIEEYHEIRREIQDYLNNIAASHWRRRSPVGGLIFFHELDRLPGLYIDENRLAITPSWLLANAVW